MNKEEYDYELKRNEIKEIIEYISSRTVDDILLEDYFKELENYITNLQEKNKRLEEIIENLTTMTVCGDKKQIKNTAQYKLDIYKSRKILQEFQKDLKNILNGDKE